MTTKSRAKKPYHHGDLRETLIKVSLKLIQEKGVQGFTLREIGARAGVSRMAAYRHFADKGDLLSAVCEAGFQRFVEVLTEARDGGDVSFAQRLSRMGLAYVRFAAEHPAHYEVMFGRSEGEPESQHWRQSGAEAFELLEGTIREGQRAGDVAAGNSRELAYIVWSMVHGISMLGLYSDLSDGSEGARTVLGAGKVLAAGLRSAAIEGTAASRSKKPVG